MSFPGESIVAATVGGALNYAGAHEANRMNRKIAREQMDFQERMSNTSYQRARQDMIAAGINPLLMAGGGGASSPGGASATMQNEMAGAVSSALQAKQVYAELEKAKAVTEQTKVMTDLAKTELPAAKNQAEIDSGKAGKFFAWWNKIFGKPPGETAQQTAGTVSKYIK